MPVTEAIAYVTGEYKGLRLRGIYLNDGSNTARIEILRGDEILIAGTAPAYKIWNYSAHAQNIIDDFLPTLQQVTEEQDEPE